MFFSPKWGRRTSDCGRILFAIWLAILYADHVLIRHLTGTLGGFEMSEEYPVVNQPNTFLVH
jgi:hypothetical protein